VADSARSDLELLGDDTTQGDLAALRQVCQDMLLDDDSVRPEAFTELVSDESAESSTNGGGVASSSASSSASSGKSSNKKGKNKQAKSGKGNSPAKESTKNNSKKNKRNSGPLAGLLLVLSIASDGSCKVKTASGDSGNNSDSISSTSISGDDDERSHAPPVQVRTFGKLFTTSVV